MVEGQLEKGERVKGCHQEKMDNPIKIEKKEAVSDLCLLSLVSRIMPRTS